jgi:hypothetical protein
MDILSAILKTIHDFEIEYNTEKIKIECDYSSIFNPVRYNMTFCDQKHLLSFIDFLKKEKIWPKKK